MLGVAIPMLNSGLCKFKLIVLVFTDFSNTNYGGGSPLVPKIWGYSIAFHRRGRCRRPVNKIARLGRMKFPQGRGRARVPALAHHLNGFPSVLPTIECCSLFNLWGILVTGFAGLFVLYSDSKSSCDYAILTQ